MHGLEERDRAEDVHVVRPPRVLDRGADAGPGSEVDDHVDSLEDAAADLAQAEVALLELEALAVEERVEVRALAAHVVVVVEAVEPADARAAREERLGGVRPYEPGGSGDEDVHGGVSLQSSRVGRPERRLRLLQRRPEGRHGAPGGPARDEARGARAPGRLRLDDRAEALRRARPRASRGHGPPCPGDAHARLRERGARPLRALGRRRRDLCGALPLRAPRPEDREEDADARRLQVRLLGGAR